MATQVSLNSGAVASAGALDIQTNGTTQAVSISTGQVATFAQNPILTSGTASGVAYLNGSKVLTTGSALVFDGTRLLVGSSTAPTGGLPNMLSANSAGGGIQFAHTSSNGGALMGGIGGGGQLFYTYTGALGSETYTERMRLDSSGQLKLQTGALQVFGALDAGQISAAVMDWQSATNNTRFLSYGPSGTGGGFSWTTVIGGGAGTQAMILNASGNLLVGDTSVIGSGKLSIKSDNTIAMKGVTSSSGGNIVMYRADTAARIWEITSNASNFYIANGDFSYFAYLQANPTVWLFASDRRIKTDIVDIEYGLNAVMAMKPRKYKMISSGETNIGFIAQELQTVIPEAVAGEEIEYLDTDTPKEKAAKTMGVSKDTLIPVLVKAIQEQQAIIQTLTARITALESS